MRSNFTLTGNSSIWDLVQSGLRSLATRFDAAKKEQQVNLVLLVHVELQVSLKLDWYSLQDILLF